MINSQVAVVGGGITGLVAGYELLRLGIDVTVLEARPSVGGKILGGIVSGVPVELGADAFLARDEAPLELIGSLGLSSSLVTPAVFGALVWTDRGLKRLPPNVMGIPLSAREARGTGILSAAAALRAAVGDRFSRRLSGGDISVAEFVGSRYGNAVLRSMVDPLLAGTRAGDPTSMSLAAALPDVDAAARSDRRVARALRHRPRVPVFNSLRGGLSALVSALTESLGDRVQTGARVTSLSTTETGYRLEIDGSDPVGAAGVILSIPAFAAAPLLREIDERAASLLGKIRYASVAVVVLTFSPGAFEVPEAISGVLVPSSMGRVLSACTLYSRKWANVLPGENREIVRCFVGRSDGDRSLLLGDDALVDAVVTDLQDAFGTSASPEAAVTHRWDHGLPQLEVGHLELISRLDAHLAGRALTVAGAGYRGTGIPDCIRDAQLAARRILLELRVRGRR